MLVVTLNRDEVEVNGFVKIGSVACAIARAQGSDNLAQAERKLCRRVNSGVQLGLLIPLDPETLEPLSHEDYGMGIVPFHELVKWGHATMLFNFKSEFISPEVVHWARAAPSMRDMVAAATARAVPIVTVTPEPQTAPVVTESACDTPATDTAQPALLKTEKATSVVHSTKARRSTLKPVIELAQSGCRNPKDTAEVWAVLLVLAEKKTAPLIGATEEGLQYLKGGTAEIFTRKSLGQRLAR
ncbi:MAG: hypothetical protein Q7K57_59245 [Burkholderiaceae bacterium]|nr:hypothetical protein [Burkholderiaceae bacterium]